MHRIPTIAGALVLVVAATLGPSGQAAAQDGGAARDIENPETSPKWLRIRPGLFQDRMIGTNADAVLELEAPPRADDPAVVPVSIRTKIPQRPDRYIDTVYLIVDNNPSPLAAVFRFSPDSGRADIETRLRVDEYSHVRAVARMNDGSLVMATRFVKASGGCSAPPDKDLEAAKATLGRMRLQVAGEVSEGKPALAQLMISHPNNSGMAMNQLTRQYAPAHFVRKVDVTYAGRPVMSAEMDFSISENPNFRFWFVPRGEGVLKAEVVDSNDLRFDTAVAVRAAN